MDNDEDLRRPNGRGSRGTGGGPCYDPRRDPKYDARRPWKVATPDPRAGKGQSKVGRELSIIARAWAGGTGAANG
ncbi:MAG: hypothetical protein DYG94_00130 [Leptolyngbya sp. PLA3]|nr:MAG: hypothetical protein EDM82_01745 [Cyanobacteria bacterium CYA]MCE7967142.1 hypothetical protein [Leptolyngbya sp. PL-A3]